MLLNFNSSAQGVLTIPPTCRMVVFRNASADTCYGGWEQATASSGGPQGISFATNEGMVLDGDPKIGRNFYFSTAGTGLINYTLLT